MRLSNFKLGIGIPLSFHMIPSAFFDSFVAMEKPDYIYIRSDKGNIDQMRDMIVRDALQARCSHLLMCDTDQMYPVDTVTRLLSRRKPVVGARIRRRYPPFDNLMFRGTVGSYTPIQGWTPGDIVEVDATGTGCILFDTEVFRRTPQPWFQTTTWNGRPVGEDFNFCARLRAAQYPIYVDTGVYVPHLSQFGITDSFAELYERIAAEQRAQEAQVA